MPFSHLAFHVDPGVVEHSPVLDDGESQAGAAGLFGMAFVHPVEPLEDPLLLILRDADAGVCDNDLFALQGRRPPRR